MRQRVPFIGAVALAVWQILQDRGNRISLRVVWQPNPGGQRRAVLQRDQRVLDDTYCTWKRRNDQTMLHFPTCASSPLRLGDQPHPRFTRQCSRNARMAWTASILPVSRQNALQNPSTSVLRI